MSVYDGDGDIQDSPVSKEERDKGFIQSSQPLVTLFKHDARAVLFVRAGPIRVPTPELSWSWVHRSAKSILTSTSVSSVTAVNSFQCFSNSLFIGNPFLIVNSVKQYPLGESHTWVCCREVVATLRLSIFIHSGESFFGQRT